jgi:transcriptional regulator with XRE-family HTH domain
MCQFAGRCWGAAYDFWRTRVKSFISKPPSNPSSGVFVQHGFIDRLREVVDHVGGQKELERLSGVDQTTISAWLKRIKNPKFQTVQRIADATGFCAEWLYLGTGPKRSEEDSDSGDGQSSLDLELLTQIIECVDSACRQRGQNSMNSHQKARAVAAAYEFYRRGGSGEVRRAKIIEFLRLYTS